jgi:hypothetical protein
MDQGTLVESILNQGRWCEKLGSPFYQHLLLRIADNVQSSGGMLAARAAMYCKHCARGRRTGTADAPLAWLRMEQSGQQVEVQLTVWPDGECRRIAVADFHGLHTTVV